LFGGVEKELRHLDHERAIIIDEDDGAVVCRKDGGKTYVSWEDGEGEELCDRFFLHNHLHETCMNENDMFCTCQFSASGLGAVTPSSVYTLRRKSGEYFDIEFWSKNLLPAIEYSLKDLAGKTDNNRRLFKYDMWTNAMPLYNIAMDDVEEHDREFTYSLEKAESEFEYEQKHMDYNMEFETLCINLTYAAMWTRVADKCNLEFTIERFPDLTLKQRINILLEELVIQKEKILMRIEK
jgi:hypothetical protein